MEIKLLKTEEEKKEIEELRREIYNTPGISLYFYNKLINNKAYALAVIDEGKMIAGCYFHRFMNTLMVDELFVKESYRRQKIGTSLIQKLVNSKEYLEELLGGEITNCRLEPIGESAKEFYEKNAFYEGTKKDGIMYKGVK